MGLRNMTAPRVCALFYFSLNDAVILLLLGLSLVALAAI